MVISSVLHPADAVGEHARQRAADRRDDEGRGGQEPGLAGGEREGRADRGQGEREDLVVVGVQGVAAERSDERSTTLRAERAEPGERAR